MFLLPILFLYKSGKYRNRNTAYMTMAATSSTNVSLKLLIETKGQKVLFAEAGKEFVDFLFNILSLPVGTVIKLLTEQGMVGSLGKLYDSIEDLSDTYMQSSENKDALLNPKFPSSGVAAVPLLLPSIETESGLTLYGCPLTVFSNCRLYVACSGTVRCPQCRDPMNQKRTLVAPPVDGVSSREGGYVKGVVTYMIMDDLTVRPMSTISSITMLNKFNVKEVGVLEEKVVYLGMDEGVKLLKASLQSKTVLTDVFMAKKGSK